MRRFLPILAAGLVLAVSAPAISPVTAATSSGMTRDQILRMEGALERAFGEAAARVTIKPPTCNKTGTSCLMWWDYDFTTRCKAGGSIHTSGHVTGTIAPANLGGTMWLHGTIMQTILDWKYISGWIVNTDPSLSRAVQLSVKGTSADYTMTRGGAWTGTTPKNVKPKKVQTCHVTGTSTAYVGGTAKVGSKVQLRLNCVPGGNIVLNQSF